MDRPKEWNERMFPYRKVRKELFCQSVKEKYNPTFSKFNIISGLMETGMTEYEAESKYYVIEEVKRGALMERKGEDD
jgi:hypothetical protein